MSAETITNKSLVSPVSWLRRCERVGGGVGRDREREREGKRRERGREGERERGRGRGREMMMLHSLKMLVLAR
jgi:hypothetical protein